MTAAPERDLIESVMICMPGGPGPQVIKLFSCSTQLSMKLTLLINVIY